MAPFSTWVERDRRYRSPRKALSFPRARRFLRPQCLSEFVARDGTVPLHYKQRKDEPGLTSIKQSLVNDGTSGLHCYLAGEFDSYRRNVEFATKADRNRLPGVLGHQPTSPCCPPAALSRSTGTDKSRVRLRPSESNSPLELGRE